MNGENEPDDDRPDTPDGGEDEPSELQIERRGNVVIQKVERKLSEVTRRYVLLVLCEETDAVEVGAVLAELRQTRPGVSAASRMEGSQGNDDSGGPDFSVGIDLTIGAGQRVLVDHYPFAECPWFDDDAPPGRWAGVYEVVGDVALEEKGHDPRFQNLFSVVLATVAVAGGMAFDLQEWKVVPEAND